MSFEFLTLKYINPIFFNKMNFEDVEERDGAHHVFYSLARLISCFLQAFGCRGMFGLRLALRRIVQWFQSQLFTSR